MQNIPTDVHQFLVAHIDSVEQLEVLLFLYQLRGSEWTADDIARELYSRPSSINRRLAVLHAKGLLAGGGRYYRYEPATTALDTTVARLAETYRQRRVAVITAIASKPMDNVRAFSDAFRLRKKDEEEE